MKLSFVWSWTCGHTSHCQENLDCIWIMTMWLVTHLIVMKTLAVFGSWHNVSHAFHKCIHVCDNKFLFFHSCVEKSGKCGCIGKCCICIICSLYYLSGKYINLSNVKQLLYLMSFMILAIKTPHLSWNSKILYSLSKSNKQTSLNFLDFLHTYHGLKCMGGGQTVLEGVIFKGLVSSFETKWRSRMDIWSNAPMAVNIQSNAPMAVNIR